MIDIVLEKDESDRIWVLSCEGHAGFSAEEDGGVDIVCAAVSALTGYLGLTFAEVLEHPSSVQASDGHFRWQRSAEWNERTQEVADALLGGWQRAALGLEENYTGWVRVTQTRWRR